MSDNKQNRIIIRRLGPEDTEKLALFFEQNNRLEITDFFHPFELTLDMAAKLLQKNRSDLFFVMEKNGNFIAFSMLRGWDDGYAIPAFGIFVDHTQHGKGFGRLMTEWTLRWADQMPCESIRLTTYQDNQMALKLYKSLGFSETSQPISSNGKIKLVMHRKRVSLKPQIYCSTQCLSGNTDPLETMTAFYNAGVHFIELSNMSVTDDQIFLECIRKYKGRLMLHNFFPSNQKNLVLNLASSNTNVRKASRHFFQRAIDWSAVCHAKFYSLHAGFYADPIGRDAYSFSFPHPKTETKVDAFNCYLSEMIDLARYAKSKGIVLLVENNVVTTSHIGKLMLTNPQEFEMLFDKWPHDLPLGILLDWGHWQVTAHTLNLDIESFSPLRDHIVGLHLHSNNCRADQHLPFVADQMIMRILQQIKPVFATLEGLYSDMSELQRAIIHTEKVLHVK